MVTRKQEEICISPLAKALIPTEMPKGNMTTQRRNQKVRLHSDCGQTYDGQMELLQSFNWSANRFTGPTLPLRATAV